MSQFLAYANPTDIPRFSKLDRPSPPPPESGVATRAKFVLLVDTTGERLPWMESAVGDAHLCLIARSKEEALLSMQAHPVDLILAGSELCSSEFLVAAAARGLSHACVFLARPDEVERLSDAYAAQHTFRVLSSDHSVEAVRAFVHGALYPREAARRSLPGIVAELTPAGQATISCSLLDLSNRGFAVRIDGPHDLLLPGTSISRVAFYRDGDCLVDEVGATVRYVEMLAPGAADGLAYKVGLELRAPSARQDEPTDTVIAEPTKLFAVVRAGLSRGGLTVRVADSRELVGISRAALDAKEREILVEGDARHAIERGDVVECRFEFAGASYTFVASVTRTEQSTEAPSYALRIPRALRVVRQRRSVRVRPGDDGPVLVTPLSPFTGQVEARRALNITASGAAFVISGNDELLPVGTRIPRLTLSFPDGTALSCRASVRTVIPSTDTGDVVCGVEFTGLTKTERARIADAIVHAGRPELRDGTGTPFPDLWNFFIDTRFLYPEKLAKLDVVAVTQTMTRLLAESNDVLKTSLFVKDGRIEGHLSGVRAYRRTWVMQHLAARVTGKSTMTRGRLLNLAVIEYLEQLPDIEWIKLWYRPTNKWPARVFGGYAKKLADPSLSHQKTYGYMVSPADVAYSPDPAIHIRHATPTDHARIEGHFVASRDSVLLRSDDLTSRHLTLEALSASYGPLGLERRREVLVAERAGKLAGFALLEVSSRGLNFSELTNTFRVFQQEPDERTRRALVARARERYRELGFDRVIGLAGDGDRDAFQVLGFDLVKDYACWTWHRSQYQGLFEHMLKLRV